MGESEPPKETIGPQDLEALISPHELARLRQELTAQGVDPDPFITSQLRAFLDMDEAGARAQPTFGNYIAAAIALLVGPKKE